MKAVCTTPPHHFMIDEKGNGACLKCEAPHPRRKAQASPWEHPGVDRVESGTSRGKTKDFEDTGTVLVFGYAGRTAPEWY